jgi:uncharacterized protein YtpQ (UPF0354 family)
VPAARPVALPHGSTVGTTVPIAACRTRALGKPFPASGGSRTIALPAERLMTGPRRLSEGFVRREFLEFLGKRDEPVTLLEEHPEYLVMLREDGRSVHIYLQRVYQSVQNSSESTAVERQGIYEQLAVPLLEDVVGRELSLEQDGSRLLPRIVNASTLDQLQQLEPVPHTPLGSTGLSVVYVLDGEHSVAFLTESLRQQMSLDLPALHALAVENLRSSGGLEDVVDVLAPGALVRVMVGDSYDAARILLLPSLLKPDQQLAVAIPDRDTLGILLVDDPEAWRVVGELARSPAGDRLIHDEPLWVTDRGIQSAPMVSGDFADDEPA